MDDTHLLRLLALVREGDDAREELLTFVRSYLRWLAGRAPVAAAEEPSDLVQDSAEIVIRNLGDFQGQSLGQFKSWLRTIYSGRSSNAHRNATRQCRDRRRNVSLETVAGTLASEETPSEIVVAAESVEQLRRALAQLPRQLRLVLILRDINHLPWRETAELLGENSESTVQVLYHQARTTLTNLLTPVSAGGSGE
jgi:RNA polymerase sigma-70 factor (ECF subfamily)